VMIVQVMFGHLSVYQETGIASEWVFWYFRRSLRNSVCLIWRMIDQVMFWSLFNLSRNRYCFWMTVLIFRRSLRNSVCLVSSIGTLFLKERLNIRPVIQKQYLFLHKLTSDQNITWTIIHVAPSIRKSWH
jgi:hypothetical protein